MRFWCVTATLMLTFVTASGAEPRPLLATAIVTGGKNDLKDVFVAIPMPDVNDRNYGILTASEPPANAPRHVSCQYLLSGRLGSPNGKPELIVLLPELKAGERRTIEVRTMPPPPGVLPPPRLGWHTVGRDTIELRELDMRSARPKAKPVARFTHFTFDTNAVPKDHVLANPTIKPYHHVLDQTGETLLTNGPDGKYPHHRGIFFGYNQVSYNGKKADVWHCRNGESQRVGKDYTRDGGLFGLHRLEVAWHGQDGAKFADEERELAFYTLPGGLLVDFRSRLTTDIAEGVKLDGDPQHAGFHFRASAGVESAAKQTYFVRPDGKGQEGEERNWEPKSKKGPVNLPWDAMCFELGGKRRTVVYLDHPDNPKEARQSERTYGRIGTYFEYKLTPDKPFFVRYRLWIQDGEMTVEQCEALSRSFTEPVKVEVK